MSRSPLFSIILPTRNRTEMLIDALGSIRAQPVQDWEVIVIDDGSDQRQSQVLPSALAQDSRIQVLRNDKQQGVSTSRNRGLEKASGEWIVFLDDDDEWDVGFLAAVQESLKELGPKAALAMQCRMHPKSARGNWRYHAMKTAIRENNGIKERNRDHFHQLIQFPPQMPSLVCRRLDIGRSRFHEGLQYGEDVLFWAELIDKDIHCKTSTKRDACVLIRQHEQGHLSHQSEQIAAYLDLFTEKFAPLNPLTSASIQAKKLTQAIARHHWGLALKALRQGMKKPGKFPGLLLYQTKLKLASLNSYLLYRLLKIDL